MHDAPSHALTGSGISNRNRALGDVAGCCITFGTFNALFPFPFAVSPFGVLLLLVLLTVAVPDGKCTTKSRSDLGRATCAGTEPTRSTSAADHTVRTAHRVREARSSRVWRDVQNRYEG